MVSRIEADLLIPGSGEPISNGTVVLEGPRIAYTGPSEGAPKAAPSDEVLRVPAVMPGMWECHGHFMGLRSGNIEEELHTPLAVMAARAAKDAERVLQAGFTSVREAGGFGVYLARAVDEGSIPGPHIYASGTMLSPTGGHGDFHAYDIDFVRAHLARMGYESLCDGVPGCLRGVRSMLRTGARVIKICSSGGVMSEVDHPVYQQFSDADLEAIVQEAGRAERVVMAHCHGKPGMMAAVAAGVASIEHGSYLDEEAAELMVSKGVFLVPTRFIIERLTALADKVGVPDYARRKFADVSGHHREAMRIAVRKGVRIAMGTDIYSSGLDSPVPWGMNAHELPYLVEAGMTPLQAIEAATANGPPTLGPQAPRSGLLREGFVADVIAVAKDPLKDVKSLTNPDLITHVWKDGGLVKAPRSH